MKPNKTQKATKPAQATRQASSEEEIQTAPDDQGRTACHTYSGV